MPKGDSLDYTHLYNQDIQDVETETKQDSRFGGCPDQDSSRVRNIEDVKIKTERLATSLSKKNLKNSNKSEQNTLPDLSLAQLQSSLFYHFFLRHSPYRKPAPGALSHYEICCFFLQNAQKKVIDQQPKVRAKMRVHEL